MCVEIYIRSRQINNKCCLLLRSPEVRNLPHVLSIVSPRQRFFHLHSIPHVYDFVGYRIAASSHQKRQRKLRGKIYVHSSVLRKMQKPGRRLKIALRVKVKTTAKTLRHVFNILGLVNFSESFQFVS